MSVAGKTGTTSEWRDSWFVGYTPYYTCGIWAGYDNNEILPDEDRYHTFSRILWNAVMNRISALDTPGRFHLTQDVLTAPVCSTSHMAASVRCPQSYDEMFEKGTRLDHVIEIQVPNDLIIQRIIGRFSCTDCGAMYHDTFKPTKVFGICDECGGTSFTRRQDDNWETVVSRLKTYQAITTPVLPYYEYQGLLSSIDGAGTVEAVSEKLRKVIGF